MLFVQHKEHWVFFLSLFISEFFAPTIMDHDDDGGKPDKKLKLEWMYPSFHENSVDCPTVNHFAIGVAHENIYLSISCISVSH